jgi:hypothetical protein
VAFLPTSTLTALSLGIHKCGNGRISTAHWLSVIGLLVRLRDLTLQVHVGVPPLSAANLQSLGNLRSLRLLHLVVDESCTALTDAVLLDVLQCMPELADLRVRARTSLSAGVLPEIGNAAPAMRGLSLSADVDLRSFEGYVRSHQDDIKVVAGNAVKGNNGAPLFPQLKGLDIRRPANLAVIKEFVIKQAPLLSQAHQKRPQSFSHFSYGYSCTVLHHTSWFSFMRTGTSTL